MPSQYVCLIAGGRDYQFGVAEHLWLDGLNAEMRFTLVVHGDAPGADSCADYWARRRGIAVHPCKANWAALGDKAGPARNRAMVDFLLNMRAHGAVLRAVFFPGGRGTNNCHGLCADAGIPTRMFFRHHEDPDWLRTRRG